MTAKFRITSVVKLSDQLDELTFMAVTSKPFDQDGNSEDNSFARWTPSGELKMTISNPNLIGKFQVGQAFYLDFSPAE